MPASISVPAGFRRWRRLAPALTGVLVLLGASSRAADPPAPPTLEEIKGDLTAIKRSENDALNGSSSLPKVALPGLKPASDSAPPSPSPAAPAPSVRLKKPDNSNWLLDAMQPRTPDGTGGRRNAGDAGTGPARTKSTSDPDFMLQLYLAQDPAPESSRRAPGFDPTLRPDVGSFGAFLGQWVSPRDPALRALIAAASPDSAGPLPGPEREVLPPAAPGAPAAGAANPFLEVLQLDLAPPAPAGGGAMPSSPSPPPALASAPAPDGGTPAPTRPPNPADDKKYFPQLDRF